MNESTAKTIDPICGMTVDPKTAIHAERDGKQFYFCGAHCRDKFLSAPAGTEPTGTSGGCCGSTAAVPAETEPQGTTGGCCGKTIALPVVTKPKSKGGCCCAD